MVKNFDQWESDTLESIVTSQYHSDFLSWYLVEDSLPQQAGITGESTTKLEAGWDPAIIKKVEGMSDREVLEKAENIILLCRLKIFEHLEWWKPYWDIMPPRPHFLAGSRLSNKIGTMDTSGSEIDIVRGLYYILLNLEKLI